MILFYIIIILLYLCYFLKKYKKLKTGVEKVLYITILILIIFPLVIYYLDRYNIPSKFGYTINTNSELWLEIIINLCVVVMTTFINAAFLIHVTHEQIKSSFDDNNSLNIENQRLQNIPLLKYDLSTDIDFDEEDITDNKLRISDDNIEKLDKLPLVLNINIENVGLNILNKLYIELISQQINEKVFEKFSSNNILKVGEKVNKIYTLFVYPGTYIFDVKMYYQDIMKNWYVQKLEIIVKINKDGIDEMDYDIKEETIINYNPVELNNKK